LGRWVTGGDGLKRCLEIGEGFDAVLFTGLDQGSDLAPVFAALVVACE